MTNWDWDRLSYKAILSHEYQIQGEPGQHFFSISSDCFLNKILLLPLYSSKITWGHPFYHTMLSAFSSSRELKLKDIKNLISIDNIPSLMSSIKSGPSYYKANKLTVSRFNMLLKCFCWCGWKYTKNLTYHVLGSFFMHRLMNINFPMLMLSHYEIGMIVVLNILIFGLLTLNQFSWIYIWIYIYKTFCVFT